jgi:hypothetical protein
MPEMPRATNPQAKGLEDLCELHRPSQRSHWIGVPMTTKDNGTTETRIRDNKHFASLLRQRLKSGHGNGALREMLARLTNDELIEGYLRNERHGREHVAKRLAGKGASE